MSDYSQFIDQFNSCLNPDFLRRDELMKSHTTWRVGGPADLFFEAKAENDLISVVKIARDTATPFFIIGGGANILASDKGYRGLIIKNVIEHFSIIDPIPDWEEHSTGEYRHVAVHFHYYDDVENPNNGAEKIFLDVSSGYSMPHFIRDMFKNDLTGLEWFMRVPGTLGGWIYNNIHGHTIFIGDFIHSVRILTEDNRISEKSWRDLDFGYDYSIFHTNRDIILSARIRLFKGDVPKAQEISKSVLIKKNERQPANSAGCVFHNISPEDAKKHGFESDAIGYVVDKKFGWLGQKRVGGAWISAKHGNFIETDGAATAQDIIAVMDIIKNEFRDRYSIDIKEEIFRVGEF
ncbi:MAG: FAD-binding protein [bacterium]|nr:FAD-binding protein [bacterium]